MSEPTITTITSALVVGGGVAGMASAIALAERGVRVDLIDIDPEWRVSGAGITITGPTLRAYHQLGLLEAIMAEGAVTDVVKLFRYDGVLLKVLDEPSLGTGIPGTGGIMRPALHRIMQARLREVGVKVRLGLTVNALDDAEADAGVSVTLSDGSTGRYDLVIGADSVSSHMRGLAFPHMGAAVPTGQGCWRISIQRPPGLETGEFYMGHAIPCGITPCSPSEVYMWLLTAHQPRETFMTGEELFATLRGHLADFGGNAGWLRDNMTRSDDINYRPLAAVLQPKPWYSGRVVLAGDAVHATTPHLACGAGMAVESGIVLAEELARNPSVAAALEAYQERRYPRCEDVVTSSVAVGRMQLAGNDPREHTAMLEGALARLNQPF